MDIAYLLIRLARRGLLAFCALFAILALLGTQALPVSAATDPSFIRLIDASPDVGTVDVFVDGTKFLGNVRFASVTNYLQLPSGPHKVELALIGKGPGAAVLVKKLAVQAGAAYTVAAIGTKSTGFSLQVFVDDNRMVTGMSTVRVYNLSPRSGALSVSAGSETLIGPVSYRQASNYMRLAAGQYTFTFNSTQPAFTLVDQATLNTNMVSSFFLVGMLNGTPPLQVVHVQVKGLPRILAGTGSDPTALPLPLPLPANTSEFVPLAALALGVLALAGIVLAWFARLWPFSGQKSSSRLRPGKLFGAALGALLALLLSLGGLSFASFMAHPTPPASTARLIIPAIGVNATIESVGVQPNGAMDTPRQNPWSDVGLYTGGPHPGDRGSAVIAGHLDRPGADPAVFWLLRDLQVGDEVQYVDAHGKSQIFHVTRIEAYPLQSPPVQEIFGNTNGRFLNLTTCAGDWLPDQHTRTMRLVVYTAFGPAPPNAAGVNFQAPLTLPWTNSSSHKAPSIAATSSPIHGVTAGALPWLFSNWVSPSAVTSSLTSSTSSSVSSSAAPWSSSQVASSTTATSPTSSSISSAPNPILTQLPAALRQPAMVKLPGVIPQVSKQLKRIPAVRRILNRATSQLTRIPAVGTVINQTTRQLAHIPLVGTVLHQVSSQVTHTPLVGTLLHRANSQLVHTPVVGTVLHQVTKQLTHTPVVGTVLHRANSQLTHIPVVGKPLQQVSNQLTHIPVVRALPHQVVQITHTPVVSNPLHQTSSQLTHTPVVSKSLHQVSKQLTHTPVVGKPLQQVRQVTRTPVVSKSLQQTGKQLTHTSVVGKSLQQTGKQLTHTPLVSKPLHRANSQLPRTPLASKSLQPTSKQLTHIQVVSKSPQQASSQLTHTALTGKPLHQANSQLTRTPAVSKSLQQTGSQLTHTTVTGKLPHKIKK